MSIPEPEKERVPSDSELIRAIARGDEQSFGELYDRYSHILLGLLLRILRSRAEAEDMLQEVFLLVWQRASNFDETRGRVFTWLVVLTRSRAIDRLRALDSRQRVVTEAASGQVYETSGIDPEQIVFLSEQRDRVQRSLAELSEGQRGALLLAYFEGLSHAEIADRLGDPLGTVKTRTRSGLMKLRELLQSEKP